MTGRKTHALQVTPVVPNKALGNFPKALCGTTGGTCSARFFRPVMFLVTFLLIVPLENRLPEFCKNR